MESVIERFLRYIQIDTESARKSDTFPSTLSSSTLPNCWFRNYWTWACPMQPWTGTAM